MHSILFNRRIEVGAFKAASLAALALIAAACSEDVAVETVPPVRPVKLIEVTADTNMRHITMPAVFEASNTSILTFQVGGALDKLLVQEGQEVTRGTVIGQLNQRQYRNNLRQAQAQFSTAETEFDRATLLLKQNAISKSVHDQRKTERDVARAALDSAQKALDDTVLRSPFDGIIASLAVEQFENVAPQQKIATLQTVGAAEAIVQAPSTLAASANRFGPAETYITLDAAPTVRIPAEIISFNTNVDPTTQTFAVRYKFTPPEDINILPGMSGSIHASLELRNGADESARQLSVPLGAVLSEGGRTFVWVVSPDTMTVSRRTVTLSDDIGEKLAVLSGLEEGEIIAGAGASYLFEGMKVRPYEE